MKISDNRLMLFLVIFCSSSFVWGQNTPRYSQAGEQILHEYNAIELPAGFRAGLQWQKFIKPRRREKSTSGFTYHIDTAVVYSNGANPRRIIYTYDSAGNTISRYIELVTNENWDYVSMDSATYDSVGNRITSLFRTWYNGSWVNTSLLINTYAVNHNMVTKVNKVWASDNWAPTDSSHYTYDFNGNKVASFFANWNDSIWVSNSFNLYSYDSVGNLKLSLNELWHDSLWMDNQRVSYTYDSATNLINGLIQKKGDTSWVNLYQESYTYDSVRNRLSYTGQVWNDSVWVNDQHYDYIYNLFKQLKTGVGENWKDSLWVYSEKGQYTYDTYGGVETYLYQQWENDSIWGSVSLSQYNYDSTGNAYLGNYYTWDSVGNLSQNNDGLLQIFFNYGNSVTYFTGYQVDIKYNAPLSTGVNNRKEDFISQYNFFPNPAVDYSTIRLGLKKEEENVNLYLYSLTGKKISTIYKGKLNKGLHSFEISVLQIPSGIYLLRLTLDGQAISRKIIVQH